MTHLYDTDKTPSPGAATEAKAQAGAQKLAALQLLLGDAGLNEILTAAAEAAQAQQQQTATKATSDFRLRLKELRMQQDLIELGELIGADQAGAALATMLKEARTWVAQNKQAGGRRAVSETDDLLDWRGRRPAVGASFVQSVLDDLKVKV